MKKLLLLIFSIILLSSCYDKEREIDISKKQERNGIVYIINESKPYSGKILRKYDNGQILLLMSYKNGKLDGKYVHFYRNGQIYIDSEYKDGNSMVHIKISLYWADCFRNKLCFWRA